MADKFGQFDNELSGGSDTWDSGLAGEILLADYFETASNPVTHDALGALVGQVSTIAGTAARTRFHATDGVLTGQGATVAGGAARTRVHVTTGALTGAGSVI